MIPRLFNLIMLLALIMAFIYNAQPAPTTSQAQEDELIPPDQLCPHTLVYDRQLGQFVAFLNPWELPVQRLSERAKTTLRQTVYPKPWWSSCALVIVSY